MKKILITGASGMLGASLVSLWRNKYNLYATGRSNFDFNPAKKYLVFDFLARDFKKLTEFCNPDIIIHCAAITNHE